MSFLSHDTQVYPTEDFNFKMPFLPDLANILPSELIHLKLPEMSLSSVATSAAIGGVLLGASYLVKNARRYPGAPPGPTRIPIIGNVELAPEDKTYFNVALQELCKKYGPIFCMYIGNNPIVVISDYILLREAFVTRSIETAGRPDTPISLAYNPGYPNTKGILDASYSEEWKRQRNVAITILRSLGWGKSSIENKIVMEAEAVLEELSNKKGEAFNPLTLIGTCVANIICSLLFGDRFEYGDPKLKELNKATTAILEGLGADPGGNYIPLMKLTPSYRQYVKSVFAAGAKLIAFYREKIEEAKLKLESGEESADFVTLYLKEIQSVNNVDSKIKEDWTIQLVSDFFVAGSETSITTLRWAMLFMANNQDVQEKMFQELDSKMMKNQMVQLQDREHLPYTEATIMEVQRIAALAPIGVPHTAMEEITVGGYRIPKGTEIWGNLYGILREPKTFPEPEKFKPERFLNETLDSIKRPDEWIPFSLGRRTCLGEQLARQELFLFFSNIMKSYQVLPPEGIEKIAYRELFKLALQPSSYEVRFVKR